jgi:hypothetical protein
MFRWLSVSQSGIDASLGDVQIVVVDGKRIAVYVQPAVKKTRTLDEIRAVAERKIDEALNATKLPPARVQVTPADFHVPTPFPGMPSPVPGTKKSE